MSIVTGHGESYQSQSAITMMMLENGVTLIANTHEGMPFSAAHNMYLLHQPARVITDRPIGGILGFMLEPWVPNELLVSPVVRIGAPRVMGLMNPSPELLSFYKAWAAIEDDKLATMGKLYSTQVAKLSTSITVQYADAKKRWATNTNTDERNNEALIAYFEEDLTWGNSKISH
jgi:hypothetical protein